MSAGRRAGRSSASAARTSSRRASAARLARARVGCGAVADRRAGAGGLRRSTAASTLVAQRARRCRSIASSCAATSGCRPARCWRCSSGLRGENIAADRSRRVAAAAAGVAVGARRGAAPLAAVDGRGRRSRERQPIGIGRLGGELYLVDERGAVIDEYGPNYARPRSADHRRADGAAARDGADDRRARAPSSPARVDRGAAARSPDRRAARVADRRQRSRTTRW